MVFCGQCGLQLPQGSTRCPRCGAAVEEPGATVAEELHSDDPTIASPAISGQRSPQTPGQQPLVLGSGSTPNGYATSSQLPTGMVNPADYTQQAGASYPGYPAQSQANYPSLTTGAYGNTNYPTGMSYPNAMQPQTGYQQIPGQNYPQEQMDQAHTAANARGRTAGLVLILFGLLFIFTAVILFAIQNHII